MKANIIVFMDGGVINRVISDALGIAVHIIDQDIEGLEVDKLDTVDGQKVYTSLPDVAVNPVLVENTLKQITQ